MGMVLQQKGTLSGNKFAQRLTKQTENPIGTVKLIAVSPGSDDCATAVLAQGGGRTLVDPLRGGCDLIKKQTNANQR